MNILFIATLCHFRNGIFKLVEYITIFVGLLRLEFSEEFIVYVNVYHTERLDTKDSKLQILRAGG